MGHISGSLIIPEANALIGEVGLFNEQKIVFSGLRFGIKKLRTLEDPEGNRVDSCSGLGSDI